MWTHFLGLLLVSELDIVLTSITRTDRCLLQIMHRYFTPNHLLLVSTSIEEEDDTEERARRDHLISAIYGAALWPVMSSGNRKLRKTSLFQKETASYIVILMNGEDMASQINFTSQHSAWNSRAMFIIVITNNNTSTRVKEVIFSYMWKKKVGNVIVISATLDIYSWMPYSSSHCGGDVENILWVDQCKGDTFVSDTDLFPDKNPKNLHGCMIDIGTFTWVPYVFDPIYITSPSLRGNENLVTKKYVKGIEVNLIDAISAAANFTINYKDVAESDWSTLADNVINGTVEVAFDAFPPHLDKSPRADTTVSYMRLTLTWFVPLEKPIARWKSLIRVFKPDFWLLVLLSYLLASATQWILGSRTRSAELSAYRETVTSFMVPLAVVLGVSVTQPHSPIVRFFFFIWIFYSLQINTAYQSMLIVVLSRTGYEHPIISLQDLLDSNLELQATPRVHDFLNVMNDGQFTPLLQKLAICTNYVDCLKRVAYQGDNAFLTVRAYAEFMKETSYVENGKELIKPLPSDVNVTYIRMLLTKGSLLLDRFNTIITRVLEGGLLVKWWDDLKSTMAAEQRKKQRQENQDKDAEKEDERVVVLTLDHLQSAFYLLFIGISTAFLIFIAECLFHWLKVRNIKIPKSMLI